ncbi:MAG: hypothetical protein MUE51_09460 [Thermoleophilia bacterium]|jgi:hypothetical protein|nr:hypothetical protein [Thermoleophilia bacterium]
MAATTDRTDAIELLHDHYARLCARDRDLREAGAPEALHLHTLAWDAERMAALSFALGHGAGEVRGHLEACAAAARGALERDRVLTGRQALGYTAVAVTLDDAALLRLIRRARVTGTGAADRARALDAHLALALGEAAGSGREDAEERLRASRALVNGDARGDDMRLLAAVVAAAPAECAGALAAREDRRRAEQGAAVRLDLVGLAILALARRQGLALTAAGPAVPADLVPAVAAVTPPAAVRPVLAAAAAPAGARRRRGLFRHRPATVSVGAEAPAAQRVR